MLWTLLVALAAEPADRVVAVVADEIVLASDARLIAELRGHDPNELPFWSRPDASVEAALIRAAAGDLALYQPDAQSVERRVTLIEAGFEDPEAFRARWKLGRDGLRSLCRRRMVVEAWLLRNVTVSPLAEERFQSETEALVKALAERLRVRRIPEIPR